MEFGRQPKNTKEIALLKRCYYAGMKNGWASGKYATMDGDFIDENDRLNEKSICFIDDKKVLKEFFKFGNWCLGQGVIYKDLFFLQQVNGGDEWATYKITDDRIFQFESITFRRFITPDKNDKDHQTFESLIKNMVNSSPTKCMTLDYNKK